MVDDWLIPVRNKAKDVVGRCEHDQKRDQSDADAQSDFLHPFTQGTSERRLACVENEMAAVK